MKKKVFAMMMSALVISCVFAIDGVDIAIAIGASNVTLDFNGFAIQITDNIGDRASL